MNEAIARPSGWRMWVLGARPRTLPAAVAPVLVGTAAAIAPEADVRPWIFLCALGVALFVQVATNYANDYSDGVRGTDDPGARTGPPRLVGNGLASPGAVKKAMLAMFGLTALSGLPLVIWVDWRLIFVGLAAIAAGWFYTGGGRPYGYAGFGEVFVFVFFGLVATMGSFYVQTLEVSWLAAGSGVAMGSLATALLVVNNLRDIPGDTKVGKRTLAVRLGDRSTRFLFVGLLLLPILMVPVLAGLSGRPVAVLALLAVVPAREPITTVLSGARGAQLIPVLARTGMVQVAYAALLSIGFLIGG
ncbi:MAG TPA: 1,4-dihydroxy-2-naphthoate polyprenyltransferase [Microthrixaceae bacterium]|nr:1,4-dihydroxy-2-naphthoate polyprenyltransferase [Microthrixaceae bacterium]